ncbi:hypothetical protein [Nocardia puris]|nr:hypothetical protein [Nocardia puris]
MKPLTVWLNSEHGPKLLALADVFELWWATKFLGINSRCCH